MLSWLTRGSTWVGVFGVGVAAVAGVWLWQTFHDSGHPTFPTPDTPPAEYLYLDTDRVRAYLGQVLGGLGANETRTDSITEALTAGLKGDGLADITGSRTRASSVSKVVTPRAGDRFYQLLEVLREFDNAQRPAGRVAPWLTTVDGDLGSPAAFKRFHDRLENVADGDFIRIHDAHLFLPAFATFFHKTRYATLYKPVGPPEPSQRPYLLHLREAGAVDRYRRLLGKDMTLPFVLPITAGGGQVKLTVFVPARYSKLVDNGRLLAGDINLVGKVIYKDPRLPGDSTCRDLHRRCLYVDLETISDYSAALRSAAEPVRRSLGLETRRRLNLRRTVRSFVRFDTPVLVVLPVAIYQ